MLFWSPLPLGERVRAGDDQRRHGCGDRPALVRRRPRTDALDRRHQLVAPSRHGGDEAGIAGLVAEGVAHPSDGGVEAGVDVEVGVRRPQRLAQLIAGDQGGSALDEDGEQPEGEILEADVLAVPGERSFARIELEGAETVAGMGHNRMVAAGPQTSPVVGAALAWRLFQARRGDDAVAQAHRTIELTPDYYDAWDNLKWIQLTLGHEAPAVEAWIRAEELDSGDGEGVERAYREGGLEHLHRESIKSQLERRDSGRYHSPFDLVLEYTALGDIEPAMAWLERSFAERETDLVDLAVDPRLDPLRGEPRFREILAEVGIPGSAE